MSNKNMNKAKKIKNDEFYTQYEDIEEELLYYKEELKGKIIYCNCDSPKYSNFYKFFKTNFKDLELKKLICTYYDIKQSYKTTYDGKAEIKTKLNGNGDFRSVECIEILKEADVIITNPPFSLFREYLEQLIEYDKKFLIIGNNITLGYSLIFKLIKEHKLYTGLNEINKFINKNKELSRVACLWYTNIKNTSKIKNEVKTNPLIKYDDYDAINFNSLKEFELFIKTNKNYKGLIGIPITALIKYEYENSDYELIELIRPKINNKEIFTRIIIKRK